MAIDVGTPPPGLLNFRSGGGAFDTFDSNVPLAEWAGFGNKGRSLLVGIMGSLSEWAGQLGS